MRHIAQNCYEAVVKVDTIPDQDTTSMIRQAGVQPGDV